MIPFDTCSCPSFGCEAMVWTASSVAVEESTWCRHTESVFIRLMMCTPLGSPNTGCDRMHTKAPRCESSSKQSLISRQQTSPRRHPYLQTHFGVHEMLSHICVHTYMVCIYYHTCVHKRADVADRSLYRIPDQVNHKPCSCHQAAVSFGFAG